MHEKNMRQFATQYNQFVAESALKNSLPVYPTALLFRQGAVGGSQFLALCIPSDAGRSSRSQPNPFNSKKSRHRRQTFCQALTPTLARVGTVRTSQVQTVPEVNVDVFYRMEITRGQIVSRKIHLLAAAVQRRNRSGQRRRE